ncbi:MAG: SRPBCC domain-containing protein [Betaproteobacteria bacterium]|nr:SRPBCC domain-containing protein [Betaproteobacteria bacterium]
MSPTDQVKVTVSVAVPPQAAFEVFTQEIDLWWKRGPRFRTLQGERSMVCIEQRLGGRVFEAFKSGGFESVFEIGRITVWQPPKQLVFTWRNSVFADGEETEVDVRFEPAQRGTLVTVVHRGWNDIRTDHPARHGRPNADFLRALGLWWGDQLIALRRQAL